MQLSRNTTLDEMANFEGIYYENTTYFSGKQF
jgi:hypothetical protein